MILITFNIFFFNIFGNSFNILIDFDLGITDLPPKLSYSNNPILINQPGRSFFECGIIKGITFVILGAILFIISLSFNDSDTNLNS